MRLRQRAVAAEKCRGAYYTVASANENSCFHLRAFQPDRDQWYSSSCPRLSPQVRFTGLAEVLKCAPRAGPRCGGIHVCPAEQQDVDGRDKPGHDEHSTQT